MSNETEFEDLASVIGAHGLWVVMKGVVLFYSTVIGFFVFSMLDGLEDKGQKSELHCMCAKKFTEPSRVCIKCLKPGQPKEIGAHGALYFPMLIAALIFGGISAGVCICPLFYVSIRIWAYTLYPAVTRRYRISRDKIEEERNRELSLLLKSNRKTYYTKPGPSLSYPSLSAWHASQYGWTIFCALTCAVLPSLAVFAMFIISADIFMFGSRLGIALLGFDLWPVLGRFKNWTINAISWVRNAAIRFEREVTNRDLYAKEEAVPILPNKDALIARAKERIETLEELDKDDGFTADQKKALRAEVTRLREELVRMITTTTSGLTGQLCEG